MNTSTRRIASRLDQAVTGIAGEGARVLRLPTEPTSNHASLVPGDLGEEARPWHAVPPVRPRPEAARETGPGRPSHELYRDARTSRARFLAGMTAAAIRAIFAAALKFSEWYSRSRRAHATYAALRELDDRSLRDLGFTRDEIRSVAAEMAWQTEHSRSLARPTFPARPSLFEILFRQ